MTCQSCNKERMKLKRVKSKLAPALEFNLCGECENLGYEPRWAIILAGRSYGIDHIMQYVEQRKYYGEEISVREVFA